MASLQLSTIFDYFLGYITDYDYLSLDESDISTLELEYIKKSVAKPYMRNLFSSITIDEDEEVVSFEMAYPTTDENDESFVSDILAKAMVIQWLQPQVRSKLNTAQMFTGKQRTWYSQANHLAELRSMLEDTQLDVRRMIRDRGFIHNSYLEES